MFTLFVQLFGPLSSRCCFRGSRACVWRRGPAGGELWAGPPALSGRSSVLAYLRFRSHCGAQRCLTGSGGIYRYAAVGACLGWACAGEKYVQK